MTKQDPQEYHKRCRGPFTDAWGKSTLPKHPVYVDEHYLIQLADITVSIPEAHRQGFICLHKRIFGIKLLKPNHEK